MVTLIEKEHLGGTCLNIGCIPTKCLLHSAELVEDIKNQGKDIGVKVTGVEVDFPQVIAHKNDISKKLTGGVRSLLKMNKVTVIDGKAAFTAPKKLSVKFYRSQKAERQKGGRLPRGNDSGCHYYLHRLRQLHASHPRSEGKPQLHRLHRRIESQGSAEVHGGHRRRRHRP